MQKIRHSTTKHRKLLLVVVIVLTVGLVGSFAAWNSDDFTGDNGAEATTTEQIEYLEGLIADNKPAEGAEVDFNTASTMANLQMQLWALYYQAAGESVNTDVAISNAYLASAKQTATEAASYYEIQLEQAPDTLNAQGKAQIIGGQATALSYAEENEQAEALFDQSLALDPTNYDVAVSYLNFLYINQGLGTAEAYAQSYLDLVGEETQSYAQMVQMMEQMRLLDEIYNSTEIETEENEQEPADDTTIEEEN